MALLALPARAEPALPAGSLYEERFRWTDDSGARVELSDFRGRTVVVTMFYSDCSSLCMTTLGKLQEIETMFESAQHRRGFRPRQLRLEQGHPAPARPVPRAAPALPARWHLLSGPSGSVRRFATRIGLGNYVDSRRAHRALVSNPRARRERRRPKRTRSVACKGLPAVRARHAGG